MQIILDVKPNYYEQVVAVLRALDRRFFIKIDIDDTAEVCNNKREKIFNAASIKTKDFKFDRDEANER